MASTPSTIPNPLKPYSPLERDIFAKGEGLLFIIAPPRSGSTLLQRMVSSHSSIYTHPEPHLITPIAHLGYYQTIDKAPFDHINAAQAMREFVEELPHGEEDYLDALRAYGNTLYGRVLAPTKKTIFLDKTPAYGLVLPFLTKLYPNAHYIVLTRHPLAILHSYTHSFFAGDYNTAIKANPIINRYVPAIGTFLRKHPVKHMLHLRYDEVVMQPKEEMKRVADFLHIPFEPNMVSYGNQKHISKSYGDPLGVEKHNKPVTSSLNKWASDLNSDQAALKTAQNIITGLDPLDLKAWGYPIDSLFNALKLTTASTTKRTKINSYVLKRKVLLGLRNNITDDNLLGNTVRSLRYYCDVLLK